jgi:hypothetical protein
MDQPLIFKTPRKSRVIKELDAIIEEWRAWKKEVDKLGADPIDPFDPKPGRIWLDGEENIKKHNILQLKTQAFLDKNLVGHGFIYGRDGMHIDRDDLRLNIRVKHRLNDLDELRARIEYAEVPAGWIKKSVAKIGRIVPDVISNVIAKLLQSGSSGA